MSTMDDRYKMMKAKLIELLNKQKYVCVTCDVWSSRAQSFIGFTVHYLEQFDRKSFALAFRAITKKQTYKVLGEIVAEVLKEYNLPISKVRHIVTDGGSAFCKMFKVYAHEQNEMIEVINEETVDLEDDAIENEFSYMQNEDGEMFVSNTISFGTIENEHQHVDDLANSNENIEELESDNEEIESNIPSLPPQKRCDTHKLNLISSDFEKLLSGPSRLALIAAMNKLHALWTFTHRSTHARTIVLDVLGCVLIVPVVTRWNSKFDAVEKSCRDEIKSKINFLIQRLTTEIKGASHLQPVSNYDWKVLQQYVSVMRPVAVSLDRLQGEQNASQGFIIPTLITMKFRISEVAGGNLTETFKRLLLEAIAKRFDTYFHIMETNRELLLAAMTLPQFKSNFIEDSLDERRAREMLRDECVRLSSDDTRALDSMLHEPVDEEDFFISFNHNNIRRNSIENQIESEISRYMVDARKNIEILDEYPNIKNVYYKHNTTLSSSSSVERLFSHCKLIFRPQRNRLSAKNFEKTLL